GTHTVTSSRPQVYNRIKEILSSDPLWEKYKERLMGGELKTSEDHIAALERAREAMLSGTWESGSRSVNAVGGVYAKGGQGRKTSRDSYQAFLDRLIADGGDRVCQFKSNVVHVEYTRFISLCDQVKGLTLEKAFLQLRWHRKPITQRFMKVLTESMVKAKELHGLDLSKTYIADVYVHKSAILPRLLVKKYLRGRGRYGATPHPKTCLLHVTLQERTKPFVKRERDPLEWIRERLREAQRPHCKAPDQVYEELRIKRPIKAVYC
ncbi:hypothetical protein HK102_009734, partial [Quaeritorhiza haematococci]